MFENCLIWTIVGCILLAGAILELKRSGKL